MSQASPASGSRRRRSSSTNMAISTRCSPGRRRSPSPSGARALSLSPTTRRESLFACADQARLSRMLVILDTHVPLDVPLAETLVRQPDAETLTSFMRRLEFTTLLRRVAEGLGAELPEGGKAAPAKTPARKSNYDHPLRRGFTGATPAPA